MHLVPASGRRSSSRWQRWSRFLLDNQFDHDAARIVTVLRSFYLPFIHAGGSCTLSEGGHLQFRQFSRLLNLLAAQWGISEQVSGFKKLLPELRDRVMDVETADVHVEVV